MYEHVFISNNLVSEGLYVCTDCGLKLHMSNHSLLPLCPRCNNHEFTKECDTVHYDIN